MFDTFAQAKFTILHWLPFVLFTQGSEGGKLNFQRILEGLLIAVVTALGSGYVSQQVMSNELGNIKMLTSENKNSIDRIDRALVDHMKWEYEQQLADKQRELDLLKAKEK